MGAIILGLIALIAGFFFCFAGYFALRIVIPIWGLFAGFALGAGLISDWTGDAVLAKPLGWILGIVLGLVFAVLAYVFYWFAIVLAMTSLGFTLGSALMTALGIDWNWLVILVALAIGLAFAVLAIVSNMPRIVLIVVSALGGATAIIGGLMLLFNTLEVSDLSRGTVTSAIDDSVWWWIAFAALAVVGMVSQLMSTVAADSIRADWASESAGRA